MSQPANPQARVLSGMDKSVFTVEPEDGILDFKLLTD